MNVRNYLDLLLRRVLSPFGLRLVRVRPDKVRGIDPALDLTWLLRHKQNPVIFDVGANDGDFIREMLTYFPSASVARTGELRKDIDGYRGDRCVRISGGCGDLTDYLHAVTLCYNRPSTQDMRLTLHVRE